MYTLESSFYLNGKIDSVVKRLNEQGHTYNKEGALWLKTTNFGDDKDRVMKKKRWKLHLFYPRCNLSFG